MLLSSTFACLIPASYKSRTVQPFLAATFDCSNALYFKVSPTCGAVYQHFGLCADGRAVSSNHPLIKDFWDDSWMRSFYCSVSDIPLMQLRISSLSTRECHRWRLRTDDSCVPVTSVGKNRRYSLAVQLLSLTFRRHGASPLKDQRIHSCEERRVVDTQQCGHACTHAVRPRLR